MLSLKQKRIISGKLPKRFFIVGVTGSGKSFAANIRFYREILGLHKGASVLLTGNTRDSLYKNVIKELMNIDEGIGDLTYTKSPDMIKTRYGVEVFCVGINNEGSDKRIQGGSVDFWYGDEPTTYPKSAFDMCMSRCRGESESGELETKTAMFTLNPDDSLHFIKTEWMDTRKGEFLNFGFNDNPIASDKFISEMSGDYVGVFYDRMIKGIWTGDPARMVIPEFTKDAESVIVREHPRPKYFNFYGALDPGFSDLTAYLVGYYDFINGLYVIEGEYSVNKEVTSTIAGGIRELERELFSGTIPAKRVSDTDWQVIKDMSILHGVQFTGVKKDNKDAQINFVRLLVQQKRIVIHPRCERLIRHLKTAVWNKQRTSYERTDTEGHFDMIDALVYLVRSIDTSTNPQPIVDPEYAKREDVVVVKPNNTPAKQWSKIF